MEYLLSLALFCVGLYALVAKRSLLKIIIGIALMGYSVNILFLLVGYRRGGDIPILAPDSAGRLMVDPLSQAIVLVTIMLGLSVTILLSTLALRIYRKYGTFDITEIRKLKG